MNRATIAGAIAVLLLAAIYYFSNSSANVSDDSARHVIAALNYHNQAARINNSGQVGGVMSRLDWDRIVDLNRKALKEAEQADIGGMNRYYPAFGDHFRDEFIRGIRLTIDNDKGWTQATPFIQGQLLVDRFGVWYRSNYPIMQKTNK